MHYIIMDYIDGQSLKYYMINQGPLEPLQALNYTRQIAEGLDTAHKQGVVHRDIKPQNILINSKDVVKITHFGLARSQGTVTLTQSNVFMGTAYYISPEQAESGHSADTRSDSVLQPPQFCSKCLLVVPPTKERRRWILSLSI